MNIDVEFGRAHLKCVLNDISRVTSVEERKAAWVYRFTDGCWEFHGPEGYYWYGDADNAYTARASGWAAWWSKLEADGDEMRRRLQGQRERAQKARQS